MADILIKESKRADIENNYKNFGKSIFYNDVFKHFTYEIGLFNKRSVEMDYLIIIKDNIEIGCGTLVYKDKRKQFEFNYEKQLSNIPDSCFMKNCYIDKKFRGNGYFSAMLSDFEKRAILHNLKNIILAVNKNNTKAIEIFKHLGFTPLKNLYFKDECFIVMQKCLPRL